MRKTLSELEEDHKLLKALYQSELDSKTDLIKSSNELRDQNAKLRLEIERKDRQITRLNVDALKLQDDLNRAEDHIRSLEYRVVSFISHE
jgi:predicted nuclease with TOPRIM domain